jgi:hypothetical protein
MSSFRLQCEMKRLPIFGTPGEDSVSVPDLDLSVESFTVPIYTCGQCGGSHKSVTFNKVEPHIGKVEGGRLTGQKLKVTHIAKCPVKGTDLSAGTYYHDED